MDGLILAMPFIGLIALLFGVVFFAVAILGSGELHPTDTQTFAILAATLTLSGVIILTAKYIIAA